MLRILFSLLLFVAAVIPGHAAELKLKGIVAGHGSAIVDVCVSPDGRWIAAAAYQNAPLVYETKTGFVASVLIAHKWGQDFNGTCVAFSPDGKRLLTGGADKKIVVWSTEKWEQVETWDRHDGAITCIGFSEDGKFVASGSDDKTVRVYASGNGKPLAKFEGLANPAHAIAFSKDGSRVIVGTDDGAQTWDVNKKEAVNVSDADREQLLTSATGRRMCRSTVRGNTAKLKLGDVSRKVIDANPASVSTLDVSSNGQTVAAGTRAGKVLVWTTSEWIEGPVEYGGGSNTPSKQSKQTGEGPLVVGNGSDRMPNEKNKKDKVVLIETYRGHLTHNLQSNGVSYTPDGKHQLSHGNYRLVRRHPGTGYIQSEAKVGGFHPPAWSKDGKVSAFACEKGIQLFEGDKPGELMRIDEYPVRNGFNMSDDGKWLAVVNNSNGGQSKVTLWDIELAKAKSDLPVGGYTKGVAVSPDGKSVVAWSSDSGGVERIDVAKAKALWQRYTTDGQYTRAGAERVVFTPIGRHLVLHNSKAIMVWDSNTGDEIARHEFKEWVFAVAVSPDGKWIAASTRETVERETKYRVHIWQFDPKAQRPLRYVAFADGHESAVLALAFSPDGKELVSSDKYLLRLWEIPSK